eukprot:745822-Hanusia_phi.AAC.1
MPGDVIIIEASGAYCSSMSTKNYNSFPEAPEVNYNSPLLPSLLLSQDSSSIQVMIVDNKVHVIRKRQEVEDIWKNEVM